MPKTGLCRTLKEGLATLLLILILSLTFSCHKSLGQIFNNIKIKNLLRKNDGPNKLIHSASTYSSHTKHMPSILFYSSIHLFWIRCIFPNKFLTNSQLFIKSNRNNIFQRKQFNHTYTYFLLRVKCCIFEKCFHTFRHLTVSKIHYQVWKELKK